MERNFPEIQPTVIGLIRLPAIFTKFLKKSCHEG
jgi:hypothetical protein